MSRKARIARRRIASPLVHKKRDTRAVERALSELAEECGPDLKVTHPRYLCTSNLTAYTSIGKHYTDVGVVSHWLSGNPELMEPEKCLGWSWQPMDMLPDPLFAAVENLVIAFRTGQPYFG